MNNKLAARIAARNKVNAVANNMLPRLIAACEPFIGKKITLQTGGFSAKFDTVIDPFTKENFGPDTRVWFIARSYGIEIGVSVCKPVEGACGCVYEKNEFTIGATESSSHNLEKLYPREPLRTDFTVAEIEIARECVKAERAALHAAEHKLCGFGEYDNG